MRNICRAALLSITVGAGVSRAQPVPDIREVAAPSAKSTHPFQFIFTVRETANGVLVNDPYRHQLILLDANLSNPVVAIDSSNPGGQAYGDYPSPNIKWLGDSSLHIDTPSRSLLVLDGSGKIVRTMAPPKQSDFGRLFSDQSGLDAKGNILYRGFATTITTDTVTTADLSFVRKSHPADSIGLVLGNFQARTVDTIAKLKADGSAHAMQTTKFDGKKLLHLTLNPLVSIDEWAVLSDGTVAIVRGYDYHVDFTLPDGTKKSSGKLPFDWKRLTDADKQRLIDSSRTIIEKIRANAELTGGTTAGNDAVVAYLRNATTPNPRGTPTNMTANLPPKAIDPTVTYDYAPLSEMADYYPPIRVGATKTDEQGNLWLLPTTSAQAKHGELVYDVVNANGAPFYRVRLPVGRSIAGFGRNGVVYLVSREGNEWRLERTRVSTTVSAKD